MPLSFELESADEDFEEEEFASLVDETSDGQSPFTRNGSQRRIATSSRPVATGRKKIFGAIAIVGLLLFILAYPKGSETIDESVDTLNKPAEIIPNIPVTDAPSVKPQTPAPTTQPTPLPTKAEVSRPGVGPIQAPGWKMSPSRLSEVYLPKGQPISPEKKQELAKTWGQWTLVDSKASERPSEDFYAQFPNRDVPRSAFPPNAWQLDTEYMSRFLKEAMELVTRAQEAILGEYGHSMLDMPGVDFEERSKMFYVNVVDFNEDTWASQITVTSAAGWHDRKGWDNLQRRILHAIMSEDSFSYLMGGHSAAAGHGNHFWQSYTLQLNKVIEPVFARLGVFFRAHNVGMGGLGTAHNAAGAKDIYGDDIDILMWDSGMTEKSWPHIDLFFRQNFISGRKVPVIWGSLGGEKIRQFALNTGGDVGGIGESTPGYSGVPQVTSVEQAATIPWAARYLLCDGSMGDECRREKYNVRCWVDRPDVQPAVGQQTSPGGQVSWHPGWRHHQIQGRTQAFALLRAIHEALKRWSETEGYALPDDAWHVTSHYETIRSKTLALDGGDCFSLPINDLFCKYSMNARTEFTPRVKGYETSLRSIMKTGGVVPMPEPNLYDPPDIRLTHLEVPDDAVDALNIIENGIEFASNRARRKDVEQLRHPAVHEFKSQNYITPGKGTSFTTGHGAPDNCDGTWDSWCHRAPSVTCLLLHHNDGRNAILYDGLSGWMVFDINNLSKGLIVVKIENWHTTGENPATNGWTCENNECPPDRKLADVTSNVTDFAESELHTGKLSPFEQSSIGNFTTNIANNGRHLKYTPPAPCPEFRFEFAIDGKVTSWTSEEFESKKVELARVVSLWTLLDDPGFVSGGPKDVELALRITGCGRLITHALTHVYWA